MTEAFKKEFLHNPETEISKIEDYWNKRSDSYDNQSLEETVSWKKERWMKLILDNAPSKKTLDILDVGTGPGFFAVNLATFGHHVTGIDVTEGMIAHARENAKNAGVDVVFQKEEGERLSFPDNSFDLIVSRNVTWNLRFPYSAFSEWKRVLRPGGRMICFDANWYLYLFDEKTKRDMEADFENYKRKFPLDYAKVMSARFSENTRIEEIALDLPLSQCIRPAWDRSVLETLGMKLVTIIPELNSYVYDEMEQTRYKTTPLFMVCAEKRSEEAARKGHHIDQLKNHFQKQIDFFDGGEEGKASFWLPIARSEYSVPVTVISRGKGKTLLVTAGVHSAEYVGIEAANEICDELVPEDLKGSIGRVIIAPLVNISGFSHRTMSMVYEDDKNLNREFPGRIDGSVADRFCYTVTKELIKRADFYIDLHCGDGYEKLIPYVYFVGKGDPDAIKTAKHMADLAETAFEVASDITTGGAYNYASSLGIPSILIERGCMGTWSIEEVQADKRDVLRILEYLSQQRQNDTAETIHKITFNNVRYESSPVTGYWFPNKKPGERIVKGELLGTVRDLERRIVHTSYAEGNGRVLYQTGSLSVLKDGPLIAYGIE